MTVEMKFFKLSNLNNIVFQEVESIANDLLAFANSKETLTKIHNTNIPGNSSHKIQEIFINKALTLGFVSEKKGLFNNIPTSNLRPDYYKKMNSTGIIIEVERGKTIMNNMDLLDFWKCHLCIHANHLFLFVPKNLKHNDKTKGYDCFNTVVKRLEPLFNDQNKTNVHSLWIFGY